MKRFIITIFLLHVAFLSHSQDFLLNEGVGDSMSDLMPVFNLRASFNDGKLWPSVKLAEGYSLSEDEFKLLREKYVMYFPDARLIKTLMLTPGPSDKGYVKWTIGTINPDESITVHGQLLVKYQGIDSALGYPLISSIQIFAPSEVTPPDKGLILKWYAAEVEMRKKLPALPPPPPGVKH